jgi:hypothetical protein
MAPKKKREDTMSIKDFCRKLLKLQLSNMGINNQSKKVT